MQERVYQKPMRNVDELKHRQESNTASLIKQLIIGETVFVRNCQFVMTFNVCDVVMNRLTHVVSLGSVMTLIRRDE